MINGVEVFGITTARASSRSIPRKNTALVGGKPLIAWTIEEAQKSGFLDRYFILTDDPNVKFVASQYGVEIVNEPKEIAGDNIGPVEALCYALNEAVGSFKGREQYVADLRTTNPLKTATDIDGAIGALACSSDETDLVAGISPAQTHPARIKKWDGEFLADFFPELSDQRQNLSPAAYVRNGSIYVVKRSRLEKGIFQRNGKVKPWIMYDNWVNIDRIYDLVVADYILRNR